MGGTSRVNTLVGANKEKILEAYRSNSTLNLYGKASEKNCWSFNNLLFSTLWFKTMGRIF